jgi:transposase
MLVIQIIRELGKRVRELERMLGKKSMEAENLKEALELARPKKRMARPDCK